MGVINNSGQTPVILHVASVLQGNNEYRIIDFDLLNAMMATAWRSILVVGTHALLAFETAACVRLPNDVMATQDTDLPEQSGNNRGQNNRGQTPILFS